MGDQRPSNYVLFPIRMCSVTENEYFSYSCASINVSIDHDVTCFPNLRQIYSNRHAFDSDETTFLYLFCDCMLKIERDKIIQQVLVFHRLHLCVACLHLSCRKKFESGDKVTCVDDDYLCNVCLSRVSVPVAMDDESQLTPSLSFMQGSMSAPVTPAKKDYSSNGGGGGGSSMGGQLSSPTLDISADSSELSFF